MMLVEVGHDDGISSPDKDARARQEMIEWGACVRQRGGHEVIRTRGNIGQEERPGFGQQLAHNWPGCSHGLGKEPNEDLGFLGLDIDSAPDFAEADGFGNRRGGAEPRGE